MAGQILGDRYEVERQLGKQAGRWTLLARDLNSQELVVIKLLCVDDELEWDDLKLFERELDILKTLSHPSIPRYLGYFEHHLPSGKALALVQHYVEGKSLEQCIQMGRTFTEPEAKQLAKAMLNILVYLHGLNPPVIHRDVKPSNILLANRRLYLVDFGSVKTLLTNENSTFTVVGTYGYMPPEQFSGRAVPASDLYSLGATLLAVITGTHPSSLPRKGNRVDLSQVVDLSPAFSDWLNWMTETSLDRRLKTAQEALEALETGQGRQPQPVAVPKPSDTKVSLEKGNDRVSITIPSLLGRTQLTIDGQKIALANKQFGFQGSAPQAALRQEINRLEYHKPTDGLGGKFTVWAGSQPFELGLSPILTEAELEWLAYELSTWLKLPITTT